MINKSTTLQPDQPKPNWSLRAYRAGDERALTALFTRVFGQMISEAHWRWKLSARPSPTANVWLAVSEDTPIFQYAGIPVYLNLPTGEVNAMVSVDTMTSPDFRRRGLLSQVGEHTYARWREAGIACVLGLPNQQWGSRTQALGWQKLFPLQWLAFPLRPQAIAARRLRQPRLAQFSWLDKAWWAVNQLRYREDHKLTLRPMPVAEPSLNELWNRLRNDHAFAICRDQAWVQWRYLDCPSKMYEVVLAECEGAPVGYMAWTLPTEAIHISTIAEIFCGRNDEATRRALMAYVLRASHAAGAQTVNTLAVPATATHRSFQRCGFIASHAFSVEVVPLNLDAPLAMLHDPANWFMAGGDFDVV